MPHSGARTRGIKDVKYIEVASVTHLRYITGDERREGLEYKEGPEKEKEEEGERGGRGRRERRESRHLPNYHKSEYKNSRTDLPLVNFDRCDRSGAGITDQTIVSSA